MIDEGDVETQSAKPNEEVKPKRKRGRPKKTK